MERGWEAPPSEFVKINAHAISLPAPLPNGNTTGIGIVLRDEDGEILLMVSGSIGNVTQRANELWSFLLGLRCAFYRRDGKVILETEHAEAMTEWEDYNWFVDPHHRSVLQQLVRRKKDKKLLLRTEVIQPSQNRLARYLAEDGAANRLSPVIFRRQFGRVRELWHLDMGLGLDDGGFRLLEEEEYIQQQNQAVQMEEQGNWLMVEEEEQQEDGEAEPAEPHSDIED